MDTTNIPATLRACKQWVCWRYDRQRKMPVNPRNGRAASTADAATWGTFHQALWAFEKSAGGLAGVGFVFTDADPYAGIDLDDCLDDDGHLASWAAEIVERFKGTYIETSPSGHGLKAFLIGRKPDGPCKVGQVECYDRGRFFTVTGEHWLGTGTDVCDCQGGLDWLCQTYLDGGASHPPTNTNLASAGSDGSDISAGSAGSVTPEDVIKATLPTGPRQRNSCIMRLARGLKFDAGLGAQAVGKLKPIVRDWHERALPSIGTKEFDDTWADFVRAWERARLPLFGQPLAEAFALAKAKVEGTPEAKEYDLPAVRLLVALCKELAGPDGGFFLSTHAAGRLLDEPSMRVYRWLGMLEADGLIAVVAKGTAGKHGKATRFRWLGKIPFDSGANIDDN